MFTCCVRAVNNDNDATICLSAWGGADILAYSLAALVAGAARATRA